MEGQGWSPDHPAQLPLALILAWALELSRPKPYDGCSGNRNMFKINWKKEKENAWGELTTVTIVGIGKSIDFYIFVKGGYYPLLPLACTSIDH